MIDVFAVFALFASAFLLVLAAGLTAGGAALFVRALPWPPAWVKRKPLICPTCLAGWTSFPTTAVSAYLAWHATPLSSAPWWLIAVLIVSAWCASLAIGALIFSRVMPPPIDLGE